MNKIPYCVHLDELDKPEWQALPEGYHITYQPVGNGHAYLVWNDHIENSCRHFSKMINNAFVAKEYKTYRSARKAVIEHSQGCTKAFFPDGKVNIIIMPPINF